VTGSNGTQELWIRNLFTHDIRTIKTTHFTITPPRISSTPFSSASNGHRQLNFLPPDGKNKKPQKENTTKT
jgi:hypothetical protein